MYFFVEIIVIGKFNIKWTNDNQNRNNKLRAPLNVPEFIGNVEFKFAIPVY